MRWIILLALACAACASRGDEAAPTPAPAIHFAPNPLDQNSAAPIAAELGAFDVAENRDDPASRTIAIRFVRLPSTAANPGAPIVYLAGGPGSGGIEALGGARGPLLRRLRSVADVIVLDQRGTGQSNAIPPCDPTTELGPQQLTGAEIVAFYRQAMAQCLGVWRAAGVDPRGYDLTDIVADMEDLRRGLGAEKLNLLSISFGGQLAMAYMRAHPDRVERSVLASPRSLHQTLRLPRNIDAFLTRTGGAELVATMRRVHARLDAAPVQVTVTPREGAAPVTMRFDSWPVRYIVAFFMLNDARGVSRLPTLYAQMDAGDYSQIGVSILNFGLDPQRGRFNNFRGMGELIELSNGPGLPERVAEWRAQVAGSVLGDVHSFPMPQIDGIDPALGLPNAYRTRLTSATPTLFISSSHDGRTPREEVSDAMASFSRATLLSVENGGHNVLEQDPAIAEAVERFLRDGAAPTTTLTLAPPG